MQKIRFATANEISLWLKFYIMTGTHSLRIKIKKIPNKTVKKEEREFINSLSALFIGKEYDGSHSLKKISEKTVEAISTLVDTENGIDMVWVKSKEGMMYLVSINDIDRRFHAIRKEL